MKTRAKKKRQDI